MNEFESDHSQMVEGYSKTTGGQHQVSSIEFENQIYKNQSNLKCQARQSKENEYDDYGDQRSYNSTNNGPCIEDFNNNFRQSDATEQIQEKIRSSLRNALSNDHIDINSYDEYKNSQNEMMVNKSQKEFDTQGAFLKSSLNDRMQEESRRQLNRQKSSEESIYCHTDRNIENEEFKNIENQKAKKNSNLFDKEITDRIWKQAEKMIIKRGLSHKQDSKLPVQINDYKKQIDVNASKFTPEKNMNTYETVNSINDQYKQLQFNGSFGKDLLKNEEYFNTRNDHKSKSPFSSQTNNEFKNDYYQYQYSNQNRNVAQIEQKVDGNFIQQIGNHLNVENSKNLNDKNQNYQNGYYQRKSSVDQTGDNKFNNFSLLNQNLNLTHDLLQRAKAQRIKLNKSYQDSYEPKSYKEDKTDYGQYHQNPDSEKQMNVKDNNYMLTMKEITERSEGTEISDEYSRFMKNQNSNQILKNSSKNQQEADSLNYLDVPKPSVKSNLKRTYEWLLSNNEGDVRNKNSCRKSERQEKSFDVTSPYAVSEFEEKQKLYGLVRSQSRDSNNQSQPAQRGRKRDSHSNEKSYHKIISSDIMSNQMQSYYANQKTSPENVQFQVNKSLNETNDNLVQKNNSQTAAPGRILRQYQKPDSSHYINYQNRSKSHSSNIQPYNFSYQEDEKKCQELKPNVSQNINNVLEQLNQKSKFNIERATYDQILYKVKSHADNSALYPQQTSSILAPIQAATQNLNNSFTVKGQSNFGQKYQYEGKSAVSDFKAIFSAADPKMSSSIIQDMKISPSKLTLVTDQSDILQASIGFQVTPTNQSKIEPLNMQQWLPHIYTELCKCRATLAQKDIDLKQKDDLLLQKHAEIEQLKQKLNEFSNLKTNYNKLIEETKQKDEQIKVFDLESQKVDSFEKEKELKKLLKKREGQIKHQYKIEMEWIERIDALISVQKLFNHQESNKVHTSNSITYNQEKQNPKSIFSKILNKLEVLFSDFKIQQKKDNLKFKTQESEISFLKNENQQLAFQNSQELELINKNFCELYNQKEDLEKVVEFLKQIILLQENLNKSDNIQQNNMEIKVKVQKCIEEFMNEENNKISQLNKLQWVQDISDASLMIDENEKDVNQEEITINGNKFYQQNQKMEKIIELDNEDTVIETLHINQIQFGNQHRNQKENIAQTDDLKTGSDIDADYKSIQSNSIMQAEKDKLQILNNGLNSNQGDHLSIQLTKYLHENMQEISNIKMENGRLQEKNKNEQKTVLKLKEEIKRKQKYEQFFINQKQKKYRNCGCQAGPSQIKASDSVHSQSQQQSKLYNKQYTEVYVSQKKTADESKENAIVNKENASETKSNVKKYQTLDIQQKGMLNVVTGNIDINSNITKSPLLSGNKGVSPLCLSSFHTSNNTHNLMNKLAVPDLSEDGKEVQLRSKSNVNERSATQNSKLSNMSPNLMTSLNIDEESYSTSIQEQKAIDSKPELNTNDQKLLKYHIKQSQELYQVLQSYISKLQVQTDQRSGSQDENHLLNQSKTIIKSIELSANQLSQYSREQKTQLQQNIYERKRQDSRKDSQTLSQNTVKNMHQEDAQGNTSSDFEEQPIHHKSQDMLTAGKQSGAFYQKNEYGFPNANSECNNRQAKENSEQTKICNYVDEYFNYKNQLMMIHKEQLDQNMILENSPSYSNDIQNPSKSIKNFTARQSIEKISARKQNKEKSFNEENQQSSKKVRMNNLKQPKSQYEGLGDLINGGNGSIGIRSRRQSQKQDCQKTNQDDDNKSECIDVSEQIKQIEGREILECAYLDTHQPTNSLIQ